MSHKYDADADKKTALWAMLDKNTKKAIKTAGKIEKQDPAVCSVDLAVTAIREGDYERALFISTFLAEPDKRFVEAEVEAAQVGDQP